MVGFEPGPWDLHVPIIIQSTPLTSRDGSWRDLNWGSWTSCQPLTHNADLGPYYNNTCILSTLIPYPLLCRSTPYPQC